MSEQADINCVSQFGHQAVAGCKYQVKTNKTDKLHWTHTDKSKNRFKSYLLETEQPWSNLEAA